MERRRVIRNSERPLKRLNFQNGALLLLGAWSIVVVLAVFHRYLQVPLGPIDDHEYPYYRTLNPSSNWFTAFGDGYVRASQEFVNQARFRPLYHLGRTLSVTVVDQAALPRYISRLFVLSSTLFLVGVITTRVSIRLGAQKWASLLLGMSSTLPYVALLPWTDVVGRLGPPDSFAWLGLVLFNAFIFLYLDKNRIYPSILWTAVFLMAGLRENYAVIAPILLISPFVLSSLRPLRKLPALWIAFLTSLLGAAMVCVTLLLRGGTDYYGNTRGPSSFGNGLVVMLSSNYFAAFSLAGLVSILFTPRHFRPVIARVGLLAMSVMFIEFMVYEETIFVYPRYGLVSKFIGLTSWTYAAIVIFWRLTGRSGLGRLKPTQLTHSFQLFLSVLLLAVVGASVASPLARQQQLSSVQQRSAQGFQFLLADIQTEVVLGHDVVIFVDSDSSSYVESDLSERSVSLQRFLVHAFADEPNVERFDIASVLWTTVVGNFEEPRNCILLGVSTEFLPPQTCVSTIYVY